MYQRGRQRGTGTSPGGEETWRELARRVELLAFKFAFPLEAEEVAQRVLLGLQDLAKIDAMRAASNPTAYLIQIVRNEARDMQRRLAVEEAHRVELDPSLSTGDAPREESETEGSPALARAIRRLPQADQDLLRLRFWKGMTPKEISTALGIPYSSVVVRIFRALRRLRMEVPPEDP